MNKIVFFCWTTPLTNVVYLVSVHNLKAYNQRVYPSSYYFSVKICWLLFVYLEPNWSDLVIMKLCTQRRLLNIGAYQQRSGKNNRWNKTNTLFILTTNLCSFNSAVHTGQAFLGVRNWSILFYLTEKLRSSFHTLLSLASPLHCGPTCGIPIASKYRHRESWSGS